MQSVATRRHTRRRVIALAAALGMLGASVRLADADEVVGLAIYPRTVTLDSARGAQSVVVRATLADGSHRDVTEEAELSLPEDAPLRTEGRFLVPQADGSTTLTARHAGVEASTRVLVRRGAIDPRVSYRLDVIPILMRAGCNSGRCHGAARGKEGFHLSLFGYDPPGDHFRLIQEFPGRRVDLGNPEQSLLLRKATGDVAHTGGARFSHEHPFRHMLVRWLREGAKDDGEAAPELVSLSVEPEDLLLLGRGQHHRLVVQARFSDGHVRDVTQLAVFLSNDDSVAEVSEYGVVTTKNPGEAFVMARYGTLTEGVPVIVRPDTGRTPFPEDVEPYGYVDELVFAKLAKLGLGPAPVCSDEVFLRRAYLDLTGLPPTRADYEAFLADPASSRDKREKLIDRLVETESFVDLWALQWGDLLRIRSSNQVSYKALQRFHLWVRERLENRVPLDEMVKEVLSASGGTFENPATNFFQVEANTLGLAENVAQSFLGMRLQCAQCHNHPFDRWTMDDYYGFAAFFGQVGFKQSLDPREFIIYDRGTGEIRHIVGNRPVAPQYLGGEQANVEGRDRRAALAEWLTSRENEHFARHMANIVWSHHFGRGIIEPVDDVRISNPPVNGPLLAELGKRFAASRFDLRQLVKDICNSRTYQSSALAETTEAGEPIYFSRAAIRRLRAEVLLDSISMITETQDRLPRLPAGARSVELVDGAISNYFLETFGRSERETVCSCEVNREPNLSQALHLLNGETTSGKIREGGVIGRLLERGMTPAEVIEDLYIRCYTRKPTATEREHVLAAIAGESNEAAALEDVFWALLNSKEFLFNH